MMAATTQELSGKERLLAKIGVVVVLLMMVVPGIVKWRLREPYPALLQPDFHGAPRSARYLKANIQVFFKDGTFARITGNELLGELPHSHRWVVLPRMFGTEGTPARMTGFGRRFPILQRWMSTAPNQSERETAAWLNKRLDRLFPGKRVAKVELVWQRFAGDLSSRPFRPVIVSEQTRVVTLD